MKTFGVLLLQVLWISLAAASAATVNWDDLLVRWDYTKLDPLRRNSFFKLPRTRSEAKSAGWVEVKGVNSNLVTSYSLTGDPRFILLFDSHGIIAGIQMGILASDVEEIQDVINMSASNWYKKKRIYGVDVWTVTVYTQDPATIASGGRSSIWDKLTGTGGVWIETTNGLYVKIPRNLANLQDRDWAGQGCVPTMGLHYFYKTSTDSLCPNLGPVFLLYHKNTVSGIGIRAPGRVTIKDRRWYEEPPTARVGLMIPDGPRCLYDWSNLYGTAIMHVFFTSEPWKWKC